MKKFSLLLVSSLFLISCDDCKTMHEDIRDKGGPGPIACIESIEGYDSDMKTCRDGKGAIWACSWYSDNNVCIPVSVLTDQWKNPIVEVSNGSN